MPFSDGHYKVYRIRSTSSPTVGNHLKGSNKAEAVYRFCDCIHIKPEPLYKCLNEYKKAPDNLPSSLCKGL